MFMIPLISAPEVVSIFPETTSVERKLRFEGKYFKELSLSMICYTGMFKVIFIQPLCFIVKGKNFTL